MLTYQPQEGNNTTNDRWYRSCFTRIGYV